MSVSGCMVFCGLEHCLSTPASAGIHGRGARSGGRERLHRLARRREGSYLQPGPGPWDLAPGPRQAVVEGAAVRSLWLASVDGNRIEKNKWYLIIVVGG